MTELQAIFSLIVVLIVTIVWATVLIHQDLDNIRKEIKKIFNETQNTKMRWMSVKD